MLFSTAVREQRAGPAQKQKTAGDDRCQHEQRDGNRRPAHMGAVFLNCLKFFGSCGLPTSSE